MTPTLADFAGLWVDEEGRALYVDGAFVTVTESLIGPPFRKPLLVWHGRTAAMPAKLVDKDGDTYLQVEAGTVDLGPTYQLHLMDDMLVPVLGLGLYDDFDDDLGVPWAIPLLPWRRATDAELAIYRSAR